MEQSRGAPHGLASNDWLRVVQEKVRGLQFGIVQIVVHDSAVVQIDRTERVRIGRVHEEKGKTSQ